MKTLLNSLYDARSRFWPCNQEDLKVKCAMENVDAAIRLVEDMVNEVRNRQRGILPSEQAAEDKEICDLCGWYGLSEDVDVDIYNEGKGNKYCPECESPVVEPVK